MQRQSRRRPLPTAWLAERLIARPRWHPPVGNRPCSVHPFLRAVDRCDRCGRPFCAGCLHHVARWRICTDCLALLVQERDGPSPQARQDRARRLRPSLLAAVVIGLLFAGTVALAAGLLGLGGATSTVAGAARRSGCLEQYPDRGRLYVVGGVSLSEGVPATVELRNCGFQPGERFQVEARIGIGSGAHGRPVPTLLAATVSGQADAQGELRAVIAIPNRVRSAYGAFDLHLRATGDQGSLASREIHGGEIVVPVTSPCPPAPQPCPPGFGRPARSPD